MSNVYQAPESNLVNDKPESGDYGSVEKALSGDYELSIGDTLNEAWAKTSGTKWTFQLSFIYYFLVLIGVMIVAGFATFGVVSITQDPSSAAIINVITQLATSLIMMPMAMGIIIMGIQRSVDAPISAGSVFNYFSKMLPLFATMILIYIMVLIGLLLLVIPGIYLMVAYYMAMPLVVEKGMSPWQAMEASRKAITHKWFSVFGLFLILGILVGLSAIPLGIGLIWTMPMMMIAFGIVYRNMFGVETDTVAQ